MPHCPECGLWVHPADPSCLACEADLSHMDMATHEGEEGAGLMAEEVSRGRLQTEMQMVEFGYSFAVKRGLRPVIVSAVLLALSWLVLPLFALLGYVANMGRDAAQGRDNIPEMTDITSYMGDGLRVFLSVGLAFWTPLLIYLFLINQYVAEYEFMSLFGVNIPISTDPVTIIAMFLVGFLWILLWPAALNLYIGTFDLRKTYHPRLLGRFLTSLSYLKSLAAVVVLGIFFGAFIGFMWLIAGYIITNFDPIIVSDGGGALAILGAGLLLLPIAGAAIAGAYGLMVLFSALGHNYYQATERAIVSPAE